MSKHECKLVNEKCKKFHEVGLIQPSSFNVVTIIIMPTKKDSIRLWTEKRMCGDYRPLNLVTPQEKYPMPISQKLFDNIGDSNIFTFVDLKQNFNQIMLATKDCKKMTSHGINKLREWHVMPFGLKNAFFFLVNHGLGSRRGKFLELLHR